MSVSSPIVACAPVRICLAGDATGLEPYYVPFGGFSVNVAIDRHCFVVAAAPADRGIAISTDTCRECEREIAEMRDGEAERLARAAIEYFHGAGVETRGVDLFLTTDVPPGSGLGSSSAMAVALIAALSVYLDVPMDTAAIADVSASIARSCLGSSVGKQDAYASAFGGCTTVDAGVEDVAVRALDLRPEVRRELTSRLLLFWIGASRAGTHLSRIQSGNSDAGLLATRSLHELKALAEEMRQSLMDGDLDLAGRLLESAWHYKKLLFPVMTTEDIDGWYQRAHEAGALGGTVTGAGGGFLLLYAPHEARRSVLAAMSAVGLREMRFALDDRGVTSMPALGEEWDRTRLARSMLLRRRVIERQRVATYSR
jgi:D-glycero-alpha-D-manno-heptose-7-phosphate kinase